MVFSISNSSQALVANICSFLLWSLATLIFNALSELDNLQVLALRVLCSMVFCCLLLILIPTVRQTFRQLNRNEWGLLFISSLLIASNWYLVIFSISLNQLSSASLGYFISPMLSVAILKWQQKEQITLTEYIAFVLCLLGAGVVIWERSASSFPWIGIIVAITFACYTTLKKAKPIMPLTALTVETSIITLPALLFIGFSINTYSYNFNIEQWGLLLTLGAVTTLPVLLYISSLAHLSVTAIGLLQYLNPSLMLLVAITIFDEFVSINILTGFIIIWSGIIFYGITSSLLSVNATRLKRN